MDTGDSTRIRIVAGVWLDLTLEKWVSKKIYIHVHDTSGVEGTVRRHEK